MKYQTNCENQLLCIHSGDLICLYHLRNSATVPVFLTATTVVNHKMGIRKKKTTRRESQDFMETGTLLADLELVLNPLVGATLILISLSKLKINRRKVQALRARKHLHRVQNVSILRQEKMILSVIMNLLCIGL